MDAPASPTVVNCVRYARDGARSEYTTSVEIATGQVVHTLDVDAVGLPEPEPWYYLG